MIGSNRILYLLQSPLNSGHSLVKMPSFGLPKILEQTINNILEEFKLASYKIDGNGPRTTTVLRFNANMADASVAYVSINTQRLLLPEVPRPVEKRRRKVTATYKQIKRKN